MISFVFLFLFHRNIAYASGSMDSSNSSISPGVVKEHGVSFRRTGWLFYLVDENGNDVTAPELVTTTALGIYDSYDANLLSKGNYEFGLYTRNGREWNTSKAIFVAPWNFGPFDDDQNGKGAELKEWLLNDDPNGHKAAANFILKSWDQKLAEKWENKEVFLVFEAVAWHGISKWNNEKGASEYIGKYWLGTTRMLGYYQEYINPINVFPKEPLVNLRGDSYRREFTNCVYQNCIKLENKPEVVKMGFDVNLRVGTKAHTSTTSGLFYNKEFSDAKTGYGIGIVWNDVPIIKTYDPPNGSPGNPENPEPNKTGTKNIVKSYYTEVKDKDTGLVTKYIDDGTYYVENCTQNIQILNEPEYKIVEWKISTTLDTGIKSTDGTNITWNPPETISRNGTEEQTVTLTETEKVVYVLLKKEEEGTGIHTYDDPHSPGKPQDPEPDKKGDCNIVKSYYTVKKEGEEIKGYTNDGTYFVKNCTNHIYIDDEPKYKVVGWKISTNLDTGIQSTDGTTITWNPPTEVSRTGEHSDEVSLTGTEKVVYVLLEKVEDSAIHTYDEEEGSPGKPENPIPDKTGTCFIVKGYYTKRMKDGAVSEYKDDGTYYVLDCTGHIVIDQEPEYRIVEWKVSTALNTGVKSTNGVYLTWNPPGMISRDGSGEAEVSLTGTEKVVYVLLEKEEEEIDIPATGDYNYNITESSITRRIWFSDPDNRLSMPKIAQYTFVWFAPAHIYECIGHDCGGCTCDGHEDYDEEDGWYTWYCGGKHFCPLHYCSGWKWKDQYLLLSLDNTLKDNYPDILATKGGWRNESEVGGISKHYYRNDAVFKRASVEEQVYKDKAWDFVGVIMRGADKLTLAEWKNEEVYPAANSDLRDVSSSGFHVGNQVNGTRKIVDYMETFSGYMANDSGANTTTTYGSSIDAPIANEQCGDNVRTVVLTNPLDMGSIKVLVETYSGTATGGVADSSCDSSEMMTLPLSGFNVSSGRMVASGGEVEFNPYIQMKYDTLSSTNKNAYVLGVYKRKIIPNDYAEISWNKKSSPNLTLVSSQWSTHAQAVKDVATWNSGDGTNAVLPGGATLMLGIKKADRQQLQITTWQTIMKSGEAGRVQAEYTGSITGLEESEAITNHRLFVESVKRGLENTNVQQYVEKNPSSSDAFHGIKVDPGVNISSLGTGASEASEDTKYYFRKDGEGSDAAQGDIDVNEGGTITEYYTFRSDTKGNIWMNGEVILSKTQDESSLTGMAKVIDERTYIVRKLVKAIERDTGSDGTNTWTDSKWYNEAFDGIQVIVQKTLLTTGYIEPTERTQVLDPKLTPKSTGQSSLFSEYFLSQFKTREYSDEYNEKYVMGEFKGDKVLMNELEQFYWSRRFWIPNVTTQDLH